jgi:hypothetical protein
VIVGRRASGFVLVVKYFLAATVTIASCARDCQ